MSFIIPNISGFSVLLSFPGFCAVDSLTVYTQPFANINQTLLENGGDHSVTSWTCEKVYITFYLKQTIILALLNIIQFIDDKRMDLFIPNNKNTYIEK